MRRAESAGTVVVMTDHGSREGSRQPLEKAVGLLTGTAPLSVDARHFMTGGAGRVTTGPNGLRLEVPPGELTVAPEVLIVYEIPPKDRDRLLPFQRLLDVPGVKTFGLDTGAWRDATDKRRTVECFRRDGVPHMETLTLSRPDPRTLLDAFERLGGDVWARPSVGAGGADVFHVTSHRQLRAAAWHYATAGQDWLLSRDAGNFTREGHRRQYRVVVLRDRVLRVCEHVQTDPDAPCNEMRGASSRVLAVHELLLRYRRLALEATRSVGLPFGGVDLVTENGGVVFEVNVHPTLDVAGGLESVVLPYVEAHLEQ